MNYSVFRISLDIHESSSQTLLRVKKGDTHRRIYAVLTEDGKPYTISDECFAVFSAKKPEDANGERAVVFNACTVEGNRILYDITPQNTELVGMVDCEFKLYGTNEELITCPRFTMLVEDTVSGDQEVLVEGAKEVSALTKLVSMAQNFPDETTPFVRSIDQKLSEQDADSAVYMAGALTEDAREIPLGENSLSMGDNSVAGAKNAIAAGKGNIIGDGGDDSVVVGKRNENYAQSSIVYGGVNENDANIDVGKNINRGARSLVGGKGNQNYATQSIINGEGNVNHGTHSLLTGGGHVNHEGAYKAFLGGSWNTNSAPESMIYGVLCSNSAQYSTLFGYRNSNSGHFALMGGEGNTNTNIRAVVFGENNKNHAQMAFVNGSSNENFETGHQAIVSGALNKNAAIDTIISGHGNTNEESGSGSVIGGWINTNSGDASTVNGRSNGNIGNNAIVSGAENTNSGINSIVGGNKNKASKRNTFTAGYGNTNGGDNSVMGGNSNTNVGLNAFVHGSNNKNLGGSNESLLSGSGNENSGYQSIVGGQFNNNSGSCAVVVGQRLKNTSPYIGVFGRWNKGLPNARLEIGSGTSETDRQSAFYVLDTGAYAEKVDETNGFAVTNKAYVDRAITNATDQFVAGNGGYTSSQIVNLIYPVGSIYMSVSEASPAVLFGGTWERLKDRFLLGAGDNYAAGTMDGESSHTLTEKEMPKHKHTQRPMAHGYDGWDEYTTGNGYYVIHNTSNGDYHAPNTTLNACPVYGGSTDPSGESKAHNNMPPYLSVYMWKRIA